MKKSAFDKMEIDGCGRITGCVIDDCKYVPAGYFMGEDGMPEWLCAQHYPLATAAMHRNAGGVFHVDQGLPFDPSAVLGIGNKTE